MSVDVGIGTSTTTATANSKTNWAPSHIRVVMPHVARTCRRTRFHANTPTMSMLYGLTPEYIGFVSLRISHLQCASCSGRCRRRRRQKNATQRSNRRHNSFFKAFNKHNTLSVMSAVAKGHTDHDKRRRRAVRRRRQHRRRYAPTHPHPRYRTALHPSQRCYLISAECRRAPAEAATC